MTRIFHGVCHKKARRSLGIPVFYESITKERILDYIGEGSGLFFSAEYNRILPVPEGEPRFFGINIHSSLLPEGRSYYPIEAAMERGLSVTGVTAHKLRPELDRGDILGSRTIRITPDMDSVDVYMQSGIYARELLEENHGQSGGGMGKGSPSDLEKTLLAPAGGQPFDPAPRSDKSAGERYVPPIQQHDPGIGRKCLVLCDVIGGWICVHGRRNPDAGCRPHAVPAGRRPSSAPCPSENRQTGRWLTR